MAPALIRSRMASALRTGDASHAGLSGAAHCKAPGKAVIVASLMQTPLGPIVAAAVDPGLCLLEFTDPHRFQTQLQSISRRLKLSLVPGNHPHLRHLQAELAAYFEGQLRTFTVPLFTPGTPFQEAIWTELLKIPSGETISYETLAQRAGRPAAIRAAGRANAMNRVSILIPCHRVVNKDGNLCGYGGGLWRKRLLLELERTGHLSTAGQEPGPTENQGFWTWPEEVAAQL